MQTKNDKLIRETADFWTRKSGRRVSEEDAREMHANLSGFFAVLLEWDAKDRDGLVSGEVKQINRNEVERNEF